MKSKTFGVYQIKCLPTKKIYVGSTTRSFSSRWCQHRYSLSRGVSSSYLQRSWDKYGPESFEFSVLEVCADVTQVLDREQHWIDTLKPDFNLCPKAGSRLGSKASNETKVKMSRSLRGKIKTEEVKERIRSNQPHLKITREAQIEIAKRYEEGVSSLQLAELFNVSKFAVLRSLKRTATPRRRIGRHKQGS